MFERDTFGEDTAWQDVYRSLQQLLEHLQIAALGCNPGILGGSNPLLEAQIAQAQFMLHVITRQLEQLDHDGDAPEWFDAVNMLGGLYGPWWAGHQIRHLHRQHLLAYAELLKAYVELLEAARDKAAEPEPSASKREHYRVS